MEEFVKAINKVLDCMEEAAGIIIDNPDVNEYFVEHYGMEVEDNPLYYVLDYINSNWKDWN